MKKQTLKEFYNNNSDLLCFMEKQESKKKNKSELSKLLEVKKIKKSIKMV